jgi:hypothetical protein
MARTVEYKVRVRPDLIRRLETAARKRDVSINQEMVSRLEQSFERSDKLKLSEITAGFESVYGRFARAERDRLATQELINAVEALIRQLPPEVQEPLRPTIKWTEEAIAKIIKVHGRTYDSEP